ncbi:hypothetical protein M231_02240 [Tremella mesenterica]|uniref:Major facilitator superfamily (MFS) profile domain-containing protein n=2 Tax=Tremella mesenterica TaxID=5217 RepID=A0A4V1M4H7_TREME|nr:hypothetical protein M231_02240 [Tremella mesenterica]
MLGNLLSAIIWLRSTSFSTFLLSRLVGGLSEGNVQLSTAIISDVTTSSTRSKSLALVGIAFSICFTLGPSLGAYFASRPIPLATKTDSWNIYATPAAISLGLLLLETTYLAFKLPETKTWRRDNPTNKPSDTSKPVESVTHRLKRLKALGRLHGLFLLFFSGAEFTLTFLTYDLFSASNAENGRLLSSRHVRPSLARLGEVKLSSYGIASCFTGLGLLAFLPHIRHSGPAATVVLYAGATCLAYTSATVVTGLTAAAAACCDEEGQGEKELQRGRALGRFRSKGQLGRAIGPLLASSIYWTLGPSTAYTLLSLSLIGVYLSSRQLALSTSPPNKVKSN